MRSQASDVTGGTRGDTASSQFGTVAGRVRAPGFNR